MVFGMTPRRTQLSRQFRQSLSGTEALVWTRLRGRKLGGWRFRRQQPLGEYFVDFVCPALRLVIEIDGPRHWSDQQGAYDDRRDAWLRSMGYEVIRVPVGYIDRGLEGVIDEIHELLIERSQEIGGNKLLPINGEVAAARRAPAGGADH
jgi:very-short-patch-repair endonuclease